MTASLRWKWGAFLAVAVVVLLCFAPDLANGLLDWDDSGYITENPNIRSLSLATVSWAFREFHCNYWAPLTWLSLAVDYAIWGLDPVGYHLTNNLLHALTAGLFFLVTLRLLEGAEPTGGGIAPRQPGVRLAAAALAATFFGIHPLRVESVVWAAERKDVLSMAFGMGSVLAYLRYASAEGGAARAPSGAPRFLGQPAYWAMLLLYVLSLLSKAMLITLPLVLLVLDWFPLRRLRRDSVGALIEEKAPMALFAGVSALITSTAMSGTSRSLEEIGLTTRLLVAFGSLAEYLRMTVLPIALSPVYFHPGTVSAEPRHLVAIAVVLGISALSVAWARRRPALLAAWLVYLLALSPVIGLTQNGPQELAPRFTYFASMATWALAAAAGVGWWDRSAGRPWMRRLLLVAPVVLLGALASLTVRDIGFWKDDVALWSRVIELQPHRFGKAYFQRAIFLELQGRHTEALRDAEEALAIATRKGYPWLHENYGQIGRILKGLGDREGARAYLDRAIASSVAPWTEQYRAERAGIDVPTEAGGSAPASGSEPTRE